ncbi:hypothetical protein WICPIJ_005959 [Wickerhamomyces pijperi]|uniref:Uncharacterized protein n=1 Tax=Wickerhamomyces pijperi TaxID=599730 RepID=A0A9P8TLC3_WICPI|nr:hypothetical protein WICPIJ_005959 [Wickerhamomyces pijperi]
MALARMKKEIRVSVMVILLLTQNSSYRTSWLNSLANSSLKSQRRLFIPGRITLWYLTVSMFEIEFPIVMMDCMSPYDLTTLRSNENAS